MLRALLVTLVLVVLLAPAGAQARWSRPIALPVADADADPGAIDDHGHATIAYTDSDHQAQIARVGLDGTRVAADLPGVDQPYALQLLPDGSVVGVGQRTTGGVTSDDPHEQACCWGPAVFRWPAGGGAVTVHGPPAELSNNAYNNVDFAAAAGGTTTVLTESTDGDYYSGNTFLSIATLRPGGATSVVRTGYSVSQDSAEAVRALPGGNTEVAWRTGSAIDVVVLRDAAPGQGEHFRSFGAPHGYDEQLAIDGRGREIRAFSWQKRLWLSIAGQAPWRVSEAYRSVGDTMAIAAAVDGAVALAFTDGTDVRLATVDRHGRRHAAIGLGTIASAGSLAAAIDARDRPHVLWSTPGHAAAVRGPHGTHRIGGAGPGDPGLAISPAGAELVTWSLGQTAYVELSTP